MKRMVLVLTVGVFLAGLIACGGGENGGKYADAKTAIRDMIDAFENLSDEIGDANDGKSIAAAIDGFVEKMTGLQERMKELEEKYPEFKDKGNVPEELKDLMKELGVATNKMRLVMQKAQKFATDSDVMNAIGKLAQFQ